MNALEIGLYSKLNVAAITDELGGAYIYNQIAPQGQARPYVVFALSGGGHENISPSELVNAVYLVKGVSETSARHAGDIDGLIKTALHGQTLIVSGYTNFRTQREEEFKFAEILADGTEVHHAGAYYRIRLDD